MIARHRTLSSISRRPRSRHTPSSSAIDAHSTCASLSSYPPLLPYTASPTATGGGHLPLAGSSQATARLLRSERGGHHLPPLPLRVGVGCEGWRGHHLPHPPRSIRRLGPLSLRQGGRLRSGHPAARKVCHGGKPPPSTLSFSPSPPPLPHSSNNHGPQRLLRNRRPAILTTPLTSSHITSPFPPQDLFWSDTPMLQTISIHEGVTPLYRDQVKAAIEDAVPAVEAYLVSIHPSISPHIPLPGI